MESRRDRDTDSALGAGGQQRIWRLVPGPAIYGEGVQAVVGVLSSAVVIEAVKRAVALLPLPRPYLSYFRNKNARHTGKSQANFREKTKRDGSSPRTGL